MGERPSRFSVTDRRPSLRVVLPPAGLVSVVLAAIILAAGCAGTSPEPWRYPAYDARDTHTYPSVWKDEWRVEPHATFDLAGDSAVTGFIGDVRGSAAPEILVASATQLDIYAMDGRRLGRYGYPVAHALPGFLLDVDADGKLDLVAGSFEEAEPSFFIINGRGKVTYHYAVDRADRDYRSLEPVVHHGLDVYLMTRENWVDSPRGFIRYSLKRNRGMWEFLVPGDPLDLRPATRAGSEPRFVVSYATRPTGWSRFLGTDHSRRPEGIDAATRMIFFGESGRIHGAPVIVNDGVPLSGNARIFPLEEAGSGEFLVMRDFLNYEGTDPDPPWVDFFIVSLAGGYEETPRIRASERYTLSTYRDFRLIETARGTRLVLLLQAAQGFHLEVRDRELGLLRELEFPTQAAATEQDLSRAGRTALTTGSPQSDSPVRLGPVLADPDEREDPRVFVMRDGGLYLVSTQLSSVRIADAEGVRRVLPWLGPRGGWLVTLGRQGEIFRVGAK